MWLQAQKWTLSVLSVFILAYSIAVLGYVASSPDLRIRALVSDREQTADSTRKGVVIRSNEGMEYKGEKLENGDILIRIGKSDDQLHGDETPTFIHFSRQVFNLRNAKLPSGGLIHTGADPSENPAAPWLVEYPDGRRMVAVEFWKEGMEDPQFAYIQVQSLPVGSVVLSFVWFILQLGVFIFAAMSYWSRPFDRTARVFFAMCIATLGAFVGGYHWWILGGRLWLNLPFSISAILFPAVMLHFFLVFPRPKQFLMEKPLHWLAAIYAVPLAVAIVAVAVQVYLKGYADDGSAASTAVVLDWLARLRAGIYYYVYLAVGYFALSLIAVRHSLTHSRSPLERGQLRWIWRAGLFACVCVGYTIWLTVFRRQDFALGAARVPMFLASLSFMLAYMIGILRYRLMLVEPIGNKGFLYYLVSCGLTVAFGLTVALGSLAPEILNITLSPQQALTVAIVVMLSAILLLWLRDLLQDGIDRQFFREKYQLDKALERVNKAVGHLADPELLAEMMLASCRDILDVDHAALYLQSSQPGMFQLAACQDSNAVPLHLTLDEEVLASLHDRDSLQRITPGSRQQMSAVQHLLRRMEADLIHVLRSGREIVGIVFLGRRTSSSGFSAEDLTFLNAVGQITNVALHSAKVDREFAQLNEDLRQKSDQITEQKRQIALLQSDLTGVQTTPAVEARSANSETEFRRETMKGNSRSMQRVLDSVRKVAVTNSTVLIRGESGTGKELLAKILHDNSPRHTGPFVRVHCAALSPGVLESELFGHVKGAFTGAHQDRDGRFRMAHNGTLFLDEIGDIAPETQVKLLRVLQERCFEPVGGNETVMVDVRLITATHRNLESLITEGRFREDLYYRLNVVSLTLPPLREREEDIYELALHFLNRTAERVGKRVSYFEDDALAALAKYAWPGNVRELENVVERAVVLADEGRIALANLPEHVVRNQPQRVRHGVDPSAENRLPYFETGETVNTPPAATDESVQLAIALQEADGNKAEAARRLGMPRSTYYSKLKKYGLD